MAGASKSKAETTRSSNGAGRPPQLRPETVIEAARSPDFDKKRPTKTVLRNGVWLNNPNQVARLLTSDAVSLSDLAPEMIEFNLPMLRPDEDAPVARALRHVLKTAAAPEVHDGFRHVLDQIDMGTPWAKVRAHQQLHRNVERAKERFSHLQKMGEDAYQRSGLKPGVPGGADLPFREPSGETAFSLPKAVALTALSDPRHKASWQLIGDIRRKPISSLTKTMIQNAVLDSAVERQAFENLATPSIQARTETAFAAAHVITDKEATPAARHAAHKALAISLFFDLLPQAKAGRLMLDLLPIIGDIREVEQAWDSAAAAAEAIEQKKYGQAVINAFAAFTSLIAIGASAPAAGRAVKRIAPNAPGVKHFNASRDLQRAINQGDTKYKSNPISKLVDPKRWAAMTKLQRDYASQVFGNAKGSFAEEEIRKSLATLWVKMRKGPGNTDILPVRYYPSNSKNPRDFDEVTQEKVFKNILGMLIPFKKRGHVIGLESKIDSSKYTKQKKIDQKLLEEAKEQKKNVAEQNQDMRGHNNPPDSAEESAEPTKALQKNSNNRESRSGENRPKNPPLDEVVLLRMPLEQLDAKALAKAFHAVIFNPENVGMSRVRAGIWTIEDLENIVEIVRDGLLKHADKKHRPIVYDAFIGVLARLLAIDESEDQSASDIPR